ncbi:MAG: glycoside hydrolase family 9 protein [Spirulina sp.]
MDQFGYRPQDAKVAVLVQPDANAEADRNSESYRSLFDTFAVVSLDNQRTVYQGAAQIWDQGNVHSQSGDRASWFDFSTVNTPGRYIIKNTRTGEESSPFTVAEDVYKPILVAATRMFFYQRSGFAKREPYADSRWTDDAAFLGPNQDTEARFVNDKENPATVRDMRGGWFDAGDTNKYVTFALEPIHQLLDAYSQNPSVWTDDFNIPESGNGVPDILDEILFELDWLKRMQDEDGGVFIKLGTLDFNHAEKPSLDQRPRFYGPKCSSSSIALSSMFSHAALVLKDLPQFQDESRILLTKATEAWDWFQVHPLETDCDTREIKSGDADMAESEQVGVAVTAAVYLSILTQEPAYQQYVRDHYAYTRPFEHSALWPVYQPYIGDALLFLASQETTAEDLKQPILNRFRRTLDQHPELYADQVSLDPYRAYMPNDQYHWGSNSIKSKLGNGNYDAILYGTNSDHESYLSRALDHLHYIHGVNPLGLVYLTNMYEAGAHHSANEMYHEWFGQGMYRNALTSENGPAPGYVTGGPNQGYTGNAPITHLPPMKVYLDSSSGSQRMWEITEPAIYYQSAYVKLLSKFLGS